jgi:hypothetical protein
MVKVDRWRKTDGARNGNKIYADNKKGSNKYLILSSQLLKNNKVYILKKAKLSGKNSPLFNTEIIKRFNSREEATSYIGKKYLSQKINKSDSILF